MCVVGVIWGGVCVSMCRLGFFEYFFKRFLVFDFIIILCLFL